MILSCMIFLFTLALQIMCDFFCPRLYTWEKQMEEDNIAVSLCILIIIASAILRIRLDRRPPRVWARSWIRRHARYCIHQSLITVFRGPRIVFRRPNREQTILFQPFPLLTLAFFTPLTDCYEWNMCNLALFLGKTLISVTYKLLAEIAWLSHGK